MEIVRSISIEALIMEHDRVVDYLESSFDQYQQIKNTCQFCELDYAAIGRTRYSHESWVQVHNQDEQAYLQAAKNRLKAQLWRKLIDESGMKTFMGAKAVTQWEEMVTEPNKFKDLPDITMDNIKATFEALNRDKGAMFNQSVVDVFKSLSWDYKSNRPHKFGKKVIVGYMYSTGNNASRDRINDLEKAFCVLDNKPVKDWRQGSGTEVYNKACGFGGTRPMEFEFDYFKVRTFKNGNAHIIFTQPGLVEKLNKIIAVAYPNTLPPKA
jgi:hypothetical protein